MCFQPQTFEKPGENRYFQGIEDNKNEKTMINNLEKIDVFWDLDLARILGRFWEAKNFDFRFFGQVFGKVREERSEREKKEKKRCKKKASHRVGSDGEEGTG